MMGWDLNIEAKSNAYDIDGLESQTSTRRCRYKLLVTDMTDDD